MSRGDSKSKKSRGAKAFRQGGPGTGLSRRQVGFFPSVSDPETLPGVMPGAAPPGPP